MGGNQYLVGGGRAALLAANPVGAVFWVGAVAALNGVGPSDSYNGLSPRTPLSTIAQAIINCVDGRGDRIILMPGTYSITAALAITKGAIGIYSLIPHAAIIQSPDTTGAAKMLTVDANDFIIDGVELLAGNQVTEAIDIANTSAAARSSIVGCLLLGSGAATASTGIQVGDGTNDAADVCILRCFIDRFKIGVRWNGSRMVMEGNQVSMPTTAGATGVTVPTRTNATTRAFGVIVKNQFIGDANAGSKLAMTFEAAEANSPLYTFDKNGLAHCAAPTADIHPEGILANYIGTATTVAPTLSTG